MTISLGNGVDITGSNGRKGNGEKRKMKTLDILGIPYFRPDRLLPTIQDRRSPWRRPRLFGERKPTTNRRLY